MDDGISAMLIGDELRDALCVLPSYTHEIRNKDKQERLSALNDLFNIYYPFPFSEEIYSKLYLSLLRSLKKKNSADTVRQLNRNDSVLHGTQFSGILGGADSFTIIGRSGIGKSTAISRSVSVIAEDVIETHSPFRKIIPALTIQCPWDASVKGMLLEILRQTDNRIGTDYCEKALKRRSTTDLLIGSVSSVCIHHVGLLIIDEIQNVVSAKNGTALIRALTQIINSSGISICMVGTPECEQFFEEDYKLARRSIGLFYDKLPLDRHFTDFCEVVWNYRYVAEETEISDGIIKWLYEHSGGITSNVISLIHAAQQIAITDGREKLSLEVLSDAYREQMRMLHHFEEANKPIKKKRRTKTSKPSPHTDVQTEISVKQSPPQAEAPRQPESADPNEKLIEKLLKKTKGSRISFLEQLKTAIIVEEVSI